MKKEPNKGVRVSWQYTHHLNSKSTTQIVKEGVFIKMLTLNIAKVRFDGNKTDSRVPINSLRFI